jgi:hypothetical protein
MTRELAASPPSGATAAAARGGLAPEARHRSDGRRRRQVSPAGRPRTPQVVTSSLVETILGDGLRSRVRRFESCWGRLLGAPLGYSPRRARPAIPRSMSFCDTCVAPRYSNGKPGRRRATGAEAFELEGMNPCYIDIDGFWLKGGDTKSLEISPIAN